MVTQYTCSLSGIYLLPPLTGIVKSSLFVHVQSSLLPWAARLHWCCANHSPYINSGWAFSRQTLYVCIPSGSNADLFSFSFSSFPSSFSLIHWLVSPLQVYIEDVRVDILFFRFIYSFLYSLKIKSELLVSIVLKNTNMSFFNYCILDFLG